MCSKEAWEHFVFVPQRPPRRLARATDHSDFFRVCSVPVVENKSVVSSRCRGWNGTSRSTASLATAAGVYSAGAAACAAITAAGPHGLAGGALLKLGMMMPPMFPQLPQGRTVLTSDSVDMHAGRGGFMDLLFPGFDTSTFIWKVSLLQMAEYLGSLLMGSTMGAPKLCSLYLLGASWGPSIANGALWRLFMPMMLHANPLHIFFNMFFQMRIGFQIEKQVGKRKFCLLYIFAGFLGNLLSVAFDPMKLAVGASTSGFGLLGVWLAEVLLTWELLGQSQPRIFLWFAFMILSCVMMSTISPNVDFMGHLGGASAGFLMALILADMREEHQPSWYPQAKTAAKNTTAILVFGALFKCIIMGNDGPIPYCGSILRPRQLPF